MLSKGGVWHKLNTKRSSGIYLEMSVVVFVYTSPPVLTLIRKILQSLVLEKSGHFLFQFVPITVQDTSPVLSPSGVRIQVRVKNFSLLQNIQNVSAPFPQPPVICSPLWGGWGVKLTIDLLVPRL